MKFICKAVSMLVLLAGAIVFFDVDHAAAQSGDKVRVVGGIGGNIGVGYDSAGGGRGGRVGVPGVGGGGFGLGDGAPGRGVQGGDGRIFEVTARIFELIEGNLGALIMVTAGLAAIVSAALGAYRAAVGLLVVAVGAFILRSLVDIFFNFE
jgi:hypothetical protein